MRHPFPCRLWVHLQNEKPHRSVPIYSNLEEMLSDASIDIAVDFYAGNIKKIHSSRLFSNKLVCVVHRDHRLLKTLDANGKVPLKQYLLEDHLIVSLSGEPQATVDDVLAPTYF